MAAWRDRVQREEAERGMEEIPHQAEAIGVTA
jgi:hypothetical protein